MADLNPIPASPPPTRAEGPNVQPVSGYAIAAAIVSGLFVLLLVGVGVSALRTGRAAMWGYLLVLPIAGFILAMMARSHIRKSEGTRGGLKLVRLSWWVCILGGVGYGAYLYANIYVIELESRRFADKFLDEVKQGRTDPAFLMLMPPAERSRVEENAPRSDFEAAYDPAGYSMFRHHELVRLVQRNKDSVTFEHVGSKDVSQEATEITATHLYHLKCPEGVFKVVIKCTAQEDSKGVRAKWRIPNIPAPNISVETVTLSQYGRLVRELIDEGATMATNYTVYLSFRPSLALMLTTPADFRDRKDKEWVALCAVGGGMTTMIPPGASFLPPERAERWAARLKPTGKADNSDPPTMMQLEFEDLRDAGILQRDAAGTAFSDGQWSQFKELWRSSQLRPAAARESTMGTATPAEGIVAADKLTVSISVDFVLAGQMGSFVKGALGTEMTDPAVLAILNEARAKGADAKEDGSVTLRTLPPRNWQVKWLRTDLETIRPPAPPPKR